MNKMRKVNGLTIVRSNETALIANERGDIEVLVPTKERALSRTELLLAAVAIKMKNEAWVDETLKALAETNH